MENKIIKDHLKDITADTLTQFRSEAFMPFASTSSGFSIGVNGVGEFVVKTKRETFIYDNPSVAVRKYFSLVTGQDKL